MLPLDRHGLMVAVQHMQLAAGCRRLCLKPLQEVQDPDLVVTAVQHIPDLSADTERQARSCLVCYTAYDVDTRASPGCRHNVSQAQCVSGTGTGILVR